MSNLPNPKDFGSFKAELSKTIKYYFNIGLLDSKFTYWFADIVTIFIINLITDFLIIFLF